MGIALTDDHRELSGVARAFLTSQKVRWAARASLDAAGDARPPFWQNLAELGWLGLHIDERHGGSGYGLSELVVVIEELGRAVAPGLFVPTVIASAVVAKEGTDDQRARLLPALIDGTLTAGVGLDSQVQVTDGVADGEAGIVLGAGLAELLLLPPVTTCWCWNAAARASRLMCRKTLIRPGGVAACAWTTCASRPTTSCLVRMNRLWPARAHCWPPRPSVGRPTAWTAPWPMPRCDSNSAVPSPRFKR